MKTIKSLFFIVTWLAAVYGAILFLLLYVLPEVEDRKSDSKGFNWDEAKKIKEEEFAGASK